MIVYHQSVTTHHQRHHDLHVSTINNLEGRKLSILSKNKRLYLLFTYTPSGCFCFNLPYYSVTEKTSLSMWQRTSYFLPQPISMALLPSATKWPYQLNPRVGMITHNFHPTFRICKYTFIAPKSLLSAVSGLLALRPYLIVDFSTSLQNQIVVVSKNFIPRSPTKG